MSGREQASVTKEKQGKRLDMKIEIEDFGPISGGEIKLKPLTVFIGPNNAGKSYAAMLIYSILESYTPLSLVEGMPFLISAVPASSKELPELRRFAGALGQGEEMDVPRKIIETITEKVLREIYQERLGNGIARSFASQLGDLVRIGKSSFAIGITHDPCSIHLRYQEGNLRIAEYSQLDINIRLKATGSQDYAINLEATGEPGYAIRYRPMGAKDEQGFLIELGVPPEKQRDLLFPGLMMLISNLCAIKLLENVAVQCYYLPAARSGILQVHKAFAASIMKQFPYVGTEKLDIPRLSGVVSDFMSSIINFPEQEGPFHQLAGDFEKELVQGEIVVPNSGEYLYPEIKYRFRDTEIPLHRSSSTVCELAPLFLYLRYNVKPRTILMIEEPEAHLHPGNQRILARLLVRLVREGVNLIITTHSEYLLEQLSNFVMLSKVEEQKREKRYKYDKEAFLRPDEVAAYVFNYDEETAGHIIDEVEITEEDGISDEEFAKVYESLYEEMIKLRRDLSDET